MKDFLGIKKLSMSLFCRKFVPFKKTTNQIPDNMNFVKTALATTIAVVAIFGAGCGNKNVPVLTEQCQLLNDKLTALVGENPNFLAEAKAEYTIDKFEIDVKIVDSLIVISQITNPLFDYFTACEVKDNLNKNLEATVNALTAEKLPITVNITDAFGDSRTYEITPANLRKMITSPLTMFNSSEVREDLFAAMDAVKELYRPEKGNVKSITTSFKGGFFSYNVEFTKASEYKGLVQGNLKSRALNVIEKRYANLGTFRPVLFKMYKSMGIDGFHLVYTDGDKSILKSTVSLSKL